jgi:hypothetical protein
MVGTGQSRAGVLGLSDQSVVSAAGISPPSTTEAIIASIKLSAGWFYKNGMCVRVFAWGSFAANGNNKVLRLYVNSANAVGGDKFYDSGNLATNGKDWWLDAIVVRNAVKQQIGVGSISIDGATGVTNKKLNMTRDETVDNWLILTALNATAATDSLTNLVNAYPETL